jgi:hypothetical protein
MKRDADTPVVERDNPSGLSRRELITGAGAVAAAAVLPKPAAAAPVSVYKIHPAIGVARMGNADPDSFFIGPEVPGYGPGGDAPGTMAPPYKANGLVKPQGVRFRIWEYQWQSGVLTPVREVNLSTPGVSAITWTVHLANKKASFHLFDGPHGEQSPYVSPFADVSVLPLRNPTVLDRTTLETDFGARTISGASQGPQTFGPDPAYSQTYPRKSNGAAVIDYLGQVRTDGAGRLIVLGGKGKAGFTADAQPPLPTYANNAGWFDDASDGPVTATVTVNGTEVSADGAWVLCSPPDFAPRIRPAVTLYDLLTDMAVRFLPIPVNSLYYGGPLDKIRQLKGAYVANPDDEFPGYLPSFADDIFPVLRSAYDFWWVTALVNQKHQSLLDPTLNDPSPGAMKARQGVFIYLRPPLGLNSNVTGPMTMPHQLGDDPYLGQEPDNARKFTLTHVQYGMFRIWANGNFQPAPVFAKLGPPSALPPPAGVGVITPDGLDRAALENAQGGAFFPGIEASWQIRNPKLFKEPFRIDLNATSQYIGESAPIGPGHFSRQMAVPWHADFNDCRHEGDYAWWPAQRPDDALPSYGAQQRLSWARPDNHASNQQQQTTHEDMLANWFKYGFVVLVNDPAGVSPPQNVETERNPVIP